MIRKILEIDGGGINHIAYLTYMLQISKYYDKQQLDILHFFNTFSGISSGSIIASAFALREKFLKNTAKYYPHVIASALKQINSDYSKNEKMDIIKNLKKMEITNCSSLIIATLISFFDKEIKNIFHRSTLRKIVSINGLLFSKYDENKENIFDKYFNFKLKDVPNNRTLVIKSINIKNEKVHIYTNYATTIKNDIFIHHPNQSISEAIHYSSNLPTYFPYSNMLDGGLILNNSLLEQIFLFKNDDLVIFKLNNIYKPVINKNIVLDGKIGWIRSLLKFSILHSSEQTILNDLLKFKYQKMIYVSNFNFTKYEIDNIDNISKLKNIGNKKSIKSALKFINSKLVVDINKIINTWKDTWKVTKIEYKVNDMNTSNLCENDIDINYKYYSDTIYILNKPPCSPLEISQILKWNYNKNTRSYTTLYSDNPQKAQKTDIIQLYDNQLVLETQYEYIYLNKIVNYTFINFQLQKTWKFTKQERNGIDVTSSLNYSLIMKLNPDFTVDVVTSTNAETPVQSKGNWTIDVTYDQLILIDSNYANESRLIIKTLTNEELTVVQKIESEEIITTYTVTEDVPDFEVSQVNDYFKKWINLQIANYEFTLSVKCYCTPETVGPHNIVVKNNSIITVNNVPYDANIHFFVKTMDQMFEYILKTLAEKPARKILAFDAQYSFPMNVYFDISEMIADEEIGYLITNFNPL